MTALAPGGRGWLLAICVSRVGAYMVYIAYAATLPVLQREWHLSGTAAGSIASAFQVAYAVSLMGCSALADRVGARRVFLVGTVASAIVAVAFAMLARDYWSGLGLYALLALALGGTYTTGILLVAVGLLYGFAALGDSPIYSTAITEVVAPAYRGSALALRSLLGCGAGAVAALLFGAILDWYGLKTPGAWGWAFVSLGIAGVGAVVSVVLLHRTGEAAALHGGAVRRGPAASAAMR